MSSNYLTRITRPGVIFRYNGGGSPVPGPMFDKKYAFSKALDKKNGMQPYACVDVITNEIITFMFLGGDDLYTIISEPDVYDILTEILNS